MSDYPLSPEFLPQTKVVIPQASWEQRVKTILVVEDQDFVREVTCEVLTEAGYRVLKAGNSIEAIHQFESEPDVQLLLTDIVLPGRNGRKLAQYLREKSPELRVLFTSGYPENRDRFHGDLGQPGMFYLPKPFSIDLLTQKVEEALRAETKGRQAAD